MEHPGYRDKQGNEVSVRLDLYFKPQPNSMVQTISGLRKEEGNQEITITVRFEARPRPWDGFWTLSGVESPLFLGSASPDGNLNASHVRHGTMEAEYEYAASLTIKRVRQELVAGLGSVEQSNLSYQFAFQCCNVLQLLNTRKNVPLHLNLHFNLQF